MLNTTLILLLVLLLGLIGGLTTALLVIMGEVYIYQRYKVSTIERLEAVLIPKGKAEVIMPVPSHVERFEQRIRENAEKGEATKLNDLYE